MSIIKVNTNPKITIAIEHDIAYDHKIGITALNCSDLNSRIFLMQKVLAAVKNDLNKSQAFFLAQNQTSLF